MLHSHEEWGLWAKKKNGHIHGMVPTLKFLVGNLGADCSPKGCENLLCLCMAEREGVCVCVGGVTLLNQHQKLFFLIKSGRSVNFFGSSKNPNYD